MAETEVTPGEEQRRQPPHPGQNGSETLPDDVEALKAQLVEERRAKNTLLNENKRVKEDRKRISESVKGWSQLQADGVDPEQIRALMSANHEEALAKAKDKGDIEKLIANARSAAEKERDAERVKRERVEQVNQRLFIDDVLNRALDKVGIDPRFKKAVFAMHRGRMKTIEDPEDEYGMRTVVEVDDDYMSADDFLQKWAENDDEAAPFLKGSLAGGGGAHGGGAIRGTKPRSKMTPAEKSAYIRAKGKVEYDKLPWE